MFGLNINGYLWMSTVAPTPQLWQTYSRNTHIFLINNQYNRFTTIPQKQNNNKQHIGLRMEAEAC